MKIEDGEITKHDKTRGVLTIRTESGATVTLHVGALHGWTEKQALRGRMLRVEHNGEVGRVGMMREMRETPKIDWEETRTRTKRIDASELKKLLKLPNTARVEFFSDESDGRGECTPGFVRITVEHAG